jgi:type II secretory pathway component GspD/PulD (secretin)
MAQLRTLFFGLFLLATAVFAQQELEIIPLRAARLEQVLPVLRPLLEPGAVLSGANNQLFIRASRRNREEIKQALAAIDKPARAVVIRVSLSREGLEQQSGAMVQGRWDSRGAQLNGRVYDSRQADSREASQMVQTVDGGQAFIQIGRSVPVPFQQTLLLPGGAYSQSGVVYRDLGQGFYVQPRLNGDRVDLEISQEDSGRMIQQPGQPPGAARVQRLTTQVSGRLGEWIELGGSGEQAVQRDGGVFSVGTSASREGRSIWLRVDPLP